MKWTVNIIEHETERVVREFSPQGSRRAAEQLDAGININLDHRFYYTEIVEVEESRSESNKVKPGMGTEHRS